MVTNYETFADGLDDALKYRSKNYVNTDCSIHTLINDVYDEICRDVNLFWITQEILIQKDVLSYSLSNELTNIVTEEVDYYLESYDMVNEDLLSVIEWSSEPIDGTYVFKQVFIDANIGKIMTVVRRMLPDIKHLSAPVYRAIKTSMVEGIMYMIQDSVPSGVDSQIANLRYQRYFAAKENLRKLYPQRQYMDGMQEGSPLKTGAGL